MLPAYTLVVDISTNDKGIDEVKFRETVVPSLTHLVALKGAFDRIPCTPKFYPPDAEQDRHGWSVRTVVMISLGKQRAEYLQVLFDSIGKLVASELPHYEVVWEISRFDFS